MTAPSSPAPPVNDVAAVAASYYSTAPAAASSPSRAPSTPREPVVQERVSNPAPRGPKVALSYSPDDFRAELARVQRVHRRISWAVVIAVVLFVLLLVAWRMGLFGA